jgi:hypothetical protein
MRRAQARVLVLLAATCAAVGCRKPAPSGEHTGAAASAAGGAAGAAARLVVATPRHDFGHVTQGDTLEHSFAVENSTNAVLALNDQREVLGCRATAVPARLEPRGAGKLEVSCHANVPGPLRVSLPLRANDRPAGELSLAAEVEPLLAFDRAVVDLKLSFGEERSVEVRLRGKRAKEARLSPAAAPPPILEASVLRGDAEKSQGVAVRALGNAVGTHAGSLRYATGLAELPEVSLPYLVKVTGTLKVSPTNPVLELGGRGPKRVVIKVESTQPGFSVSRAEVLEGPFSAQVRRTESGFDVEVTALESKLMPGARGVNGRIRIVSNDRTERVKEVPLFGLGAPPVSRRASPP